MENGKKYIKFIDSHYKELFMIEDGKNVVITDAAGGQRKLKCEYIDEYHTRIGSNTMHICQFAERMERAGTKYKPEEFITDKEFYKKLYLDGNLEKENGDKIPFYMIDKNERWAFGYCPQGKDHQMCLWDKANNEKHYGETLDEISGILEDSGLNAKMIRAVVKGMKEREKLENMSLEETLADDRPLNERIKANTKTANESNKEPKTKEKKKDEPEY